jgi:hypothetical protein
VNSIYDKKYNLRLPSTVFEQVEALGTKYERSVNEQIVYMLKTWKEPGALDDRLARLENYIYKEERKSASGE